MFLLYENLFCNDHKHSLIESMGKPIYIYVDAFIFCNSDFRYWLKLYLTINFNNIVINIDSKNGGF